MAVPQAPPPITAQRMRAHVRADHGASPSECCRVAASASCVVRPPDPSLGALSQPRDILAMCPEHERGTRARSTMTSGGDAHAPAAQRAIGSTSAPMSEPSETYRDAATIDDERDECSNGGHRRQREKHAARRGDALAAALAAAGTRVAHVRRSPRRRTPRPTAIRRATHQRRQQTRQQRNGKHALQHVDDVNEQSRLPAECSQHVRRAEIARSHGAQVHPVCTSNEIRRGSEPSSYARRAQSEQEREASLRRALSPHEDAQRRPGEAPLRAEAVVQEPDVVLRIEIGMVAEERRSSAARLPPAWRS